MLAQLRRESGRMTCKISNMDMYEKEQELRTVFTTDPEPEIGPENGQDRIMRYSRRSRLARWGGRLTFVLLVSMISAALMSDPRIRDYIDDGIAVWKDEARATLPFLFSQQTSNASGSSDEDAHVAPSDTANPERHGRPPVSILPNSAVPVRRAGG